MMTSTPPQSLCEPVRQLSRLPMAGKTVILCIKGIKAFTDERLTEAAEELLPPKTGLAI